MKFDPVNWKMVSHPLNWAVVVLTLIIAGAIGHYILTLIGLEPVKGRGKSSYGDVSPGQIPGDQAVVAVEPEAVGYTS